MQLELLDVHLPDGKETTREIVRVRDAVAVLLLDDDQNIHLVKQARPAIEQTLISIPAGLIDESESEEDAARRECEEETGYVPQRLHRIVKYAHAEGYSTGFITLFLGLDLVYSGNTNQDASEYVEQLKMPFQELYEKVCENEIIDSKTLLSVLFVQQQYQQFLHPSSTNILGANS